MEPRLLTGPASIIIGCLLLTIALRLWLVHPLNRVFRVGPFVTERGLRALLNMRILLFSFGLFFVCQGASQVIYWGFAHGDDRYPPVVLLGSLSAGFALWAASLAVIAAVRLWRVK